MTTPNARPTRRGSVAYAAVFWIAALALFVGPFLGSKDAPETDYEDAGRLVSEIDLTFREDVSSFEDEFGVELAPAIREVADDVFALGSPVLHEELGIHPRRAQAGQLAFELLCAGCHNHNGDGGGPAATHLEPRPRNFRKGLFKFTSTASGERPLPEDLFSTITRGLAGSSMPSFRLVSEEQRWDLVHYVRWLAVRGEFEQLALDVAWEEEEVPDMEELVDIVFDRWDPETLQATYPAASEPPNDAESIARGRELYNDTSIANCAACHGESGVGDGPSANAFLDGWGYPIAPRDLTTGVYRAGSSPADLYRSIATGINGTPMPAFGGSIPAEGIWDLVHYVQSLAEEGNQ